MPRKSPRLNTTERALKDLERHGLKPRRLVLHPDGSAEVEVDLGDQPEPKKAAVDRNANEWDRI